MWTVQKDICDIGKDWEIMSNTAAMMHDKTTGDVSFVDPCLIKHEADVIW